MTMQTVRKREMALREGRKILIAILAAFLYAAGVNFFIVPAHLYNGGIMGICQVIRTLLMDLLGGTRYFAYFQNFDIAGLIYYVFNLPIFLLAITRVGKKFFLKTLITVTAMTFFLAVLPITAVVEDVLAASMVGGILSGTALGLILRMGSSGGGMDVIGVFLIKWKKDFSVGKVNLMVNVVLYLACLFLFDRNIVIYSVIYAAVSAVAMDKAHIQNINVEVTVITKIHTEDLEREVFHELNRGITKWQCLGTYTYQQSHILYIILSKYEVHRLKAIIHQYDPHAFLVVNEGVSVDGHYLKKL